jgi:hypothetical protein
MLNNNFIFFIFFSIYFEFFLGISILYCLIVYTFLKNNIKKLFIQVIISECFCFIFFSSSFLILNDDFFIFYENVYNINNFF